jgi:ubiquilin
MMNPQVMRSMAQLQQAMGGFPSPGTAVPPFHPVAGSAGQQSSPFAAAATGRTGVDNAGMDFTSLFQSLQNTQMTGGAGLSSTATASVSPQNPAERYRQQLRSLYDMGFDDEQQNLSALQAAHGNLNRAVDMLLAGEVPSSSISAPNAAVNNSADNAPAPEPKDEQDKKND